MKNVKLKRIAASFLPMIVVFSFHILLWKIFHIYWHLPSFDIPMHFAGGFATAWTLYLLYKIISKKREFRIKSKILLYLFIISATSLVVTMWEFLEFTHDYFFPLLQQQFGLADTMCDMLMGLTGSALFCLGLSCRRKKKNKRMMKMLEIIKKIKGRKSKAKKRKLKKSKRHS